MFNGNLRYLYVCIVFSMVCSRARLRITLTVRRTAHFTQAGVALTNAVDNTHCRIRGNKLKRRRERERDKKEEARMEVRII